jgi:hypothetical protein
MYGNQLLVSGRETKLEAATCNYYQMLRKADKHSCHYFISHELVLH